MNIPRVMDEEGVVHRTWSMWMMNDEEGSERKTKQLLLFYRALAGTSQRHNKLVEMARAFVAAASDIGELKAGADGGNKARGIEAAYGTIILLATAKLKLRVLRYLEVFWPSGH